MTAACGRIGFAPQPADAGSGADAGVTACEQAWLTTTPTLSVPQLIPSIDGPSYEQTEFLTADLLTLYFSSDPAGNDDVFSTQRATPTDAFGSPTAVTDINTAFNDLELVISPDGLELWLASDRPGGAGGYDLWRATRASVADGFGGLAVVPEVSSTGSEYNERISSDGQRIYFAAAGRPGGVGATDLWMATRPTSADPFATPTLIAELDTTVDDASPNPTASERVIVYTSNRSGTSGGLDLWFATRADRNDPFGPPAPVPVVNTASTEFTPYLRPDGCELFFVSDRGANHDIFVSQVVP